MNDREEFAYDPTKDESGENVAMSASTSGIPTWANVVVVLI